MIRVRCRWICYACKIGLELYIYTIYILYIFCIYLELISQNKHNISYIIVLSQVSTAFLMQPDPGLRQLHRILCLGKNSAERSAVRLDSVQFPVVNSNPHFLTESA